MAEIIHPLESLSTATATTKVEWIAASKLELNDLGGGGCQETEPCMEFCQAERCDLISNFMSFKIAGASRLNYCGSSESLEFEECQVHVSWVRGREGCHSGSKLQFLI